MFILAIRGNGSLCDNVLLSPNRREETMLRYSTLLIVLVLFLPLTAHAQTMTKADRFKLWNDCRKIRVVVERLHEQASRKGLDRQELRSALRKYLHGKNLYDATATTFLYVRIGMTKSAFNLDIDYFKPVRDTITGIKRNAKTWSSGNFGSYRTTKIIWTALIEQLREFVYQYRRVNKIACRRR